MPLLVPTRRVTSSLALLAFLGCGRNATTPDARGLVLDWMQERDRTLLGGSGRRFIPDSVHFERRESSGVPGMAYMWGRYSPPGTADIMIQVAAAEDANRPVLLLSPADWLDAALAHGWQPSDGEMALAGCEEAISVAGPRSSLLSPPLPYRDSSSLTNPSLLPIMAKDLEATHRLGPPVSTALGPTTWEVSLWVIEGRQTTKYRCQVGAHGIALVPVDSIADLGLMTIGP